MDTKRCDGYESNYTAEPVDPRDKEAQDMLKEIMRLEGIHEQTLIAVKEYIRKARSSGAAAHLANYIESLYRDELS